MRPRVTYGGWPNLRHHLLILLLVLGGCAARPGADALIPIAAGAPNAQAVSVLVATNRSFGDSEQADHSSGRGALRYYEYTVAVPPNHVSGRVEWSPDSRTDPAKGFAVVRRLRLTESGFRNAVATRGSGGDTAGIFIHGYNYTFAEAIFRMAQLAVDAPSVAVPILFSWPSEAAVAGYVADRDAATYARDDLAHVLALVAGIRMQQQVVLAGHSMGGWLVMETLRQLRLQGRDDVLRRFQVALAAPDIDVDVFRRQVDVIGRLSPASTILVARDDRALDFSGALTGGRRRVGTADVDDPVLQDVARRQHLRIVDISSVHASDGMLHDRFARFAAIHSTALAGGGSAASSLQQAGAFLFNAAGAALASPFTMMGRTLQSAD